MTDGAQLSTLYQHVRGICIVHSCHMPFLWQGRPTGRALLPAGHRAGKLSSSHGRTVGGAQRTGAAPGAGQRA